MPIKETAATLAHLMAQAKNAVNIQQLVQSLLTELGGMDKFAKEWAEAFHSTKPGSIARTKMLQDMMNLVKMATPKGSSGDVSHLSDEELHRFLGTLVEKAGITQQPLASTEEHGTDTDSPG